MQQISYVSNQTPPPLQLISARTLFAARPTDPPSSPPPTSPLPSLPETALYEGQKGFPTIRDASRSDRPARPPRPTTSLPDLKPRTITSPEIYRRQRNTELAAQVKCSPNQQQSSIKTRSGRAPPANPEHRNSVRLLTPTSQFSSTFSDDVLSALPKLFHLSPIQCLDTSVGLNGGIGSDRLRAWQVYHRSPSRSASKPKQRKTDTKKPVARTALFVPRTPPCEPDAFGIHYPANNGPHSGTSQSCYATQSQTTSSGSLFPPRRSSKTRLTGSPATKPPSPSHKRSQAVTTFTFDFGNCYGSSEGGSRSHGSSDDNLTSLPKLPPSPNVRCLASLQHTPWGKSQPPPYVCTGEEHLNQVPHEVIAFASVPYAHTISNAGPQPKTERDHLINSTCLTSPQPHDSTTNGYLPRSAPRRVDFHARGPSLDLDLESHEEEGEETREFTEGEIKMAKRERLLWIIATISLVLMATAGILGGIISRLTNIGHRQ